MIIFYLYFIAALLLFYGAGSVCFRLVDETRLSQPSRLFLRVLIGVIVCTSILAMASTALKTVFVFFPVILVGLSLLNRRSLSRPGILAKEHLLHALLAASLIFLFSYLTAGGDCSGNVYFLDEYYYAAEGRDMVRGGIESSSVYLMDVGLDAIRPNPYHYFDLWLQGFLWVLVDEASAISVQLLLTHSVLWTLMLLGFRALICESSRARTKDIHLWCLALLALPITGIDLPLDFGLSFAVASFLNGLQAAKLSVHVVFLIAASILHLRNQTGGAALFLLCAAVASATAWMGIMGTVLLISLTARFHRLVGPRTSSGLCVATLLLAGGLLTFYAVFGSGTGASPRIDAWALVATLVKGSLMWAFTGTILAIIIGLAGKLDRRERQLVVGMALLLICANLGWSLVYYQADGEQVFLNLASAVATVALVWAGGRLASRSLKYSFAALGVLAAVCSSATVLHGLGPIEPRAVSREFAQKVEHLLPTGAGLVRVGVLWRPAVNDPLASFRSNTNLHSLAKVGFLMCYPDVRVVSLADADVPFSPKETVRMDQVRSLERQPYYVFLQRRVNTGPAGTSEMLAFARAVGIRFLAFRSVDNQPAGLSGCLRILAEDHLTGWKVAELDARRR